MAKTVTLVAKAFLTYGGRGYGQNMQFVADPDDAKRLIESGEAVPAPVKRAAILSAPAVDEVVETPRARRSQKE